MANKRRSGMSEHAGNQMDYNNQNRKKVEKSLGKKRMQDSMDQLMRERATGYNSTGDENNNGRRFGPRAKSHNSSLPMKGRAIY